MLRKGGMTVRYTAPIVVEKALELLGVEPLYQKYAAEARINGFSSATRDRRRQDILWLNDNSGGLRPYSSCGAKHCVYIASRTEEVSGLPECEGERTLVALPHTVSLRRLVSAMEQCFAFYNAWDEALLDVIRRGGDWYELLSVGHRVIGNPMIIYNRSMRVLAYTDDDSARDPLWTDTVRDGVARTDSESLSADLMRFLYEVEEHDAPFRFKGEGMSEPFWSAPVRVGGRPRGMVNAVEYHRPLSAGGRDLLGFFAEFVAIGMQCSDVGGPVPDAVPRQFMLDLLEGEIASRELLNTRLIAVDWQAMHSFRFVVLRAGLPFLTGEQWRSYYDRLTALKLNGLACIIDRPEPHIGLLLTAADPDRFARVLETVDRFCAINPLRAGVSDTYEDLLDTPRFYRQAQVALELMDASVCFYESARYPRMLRHLRSHARREDLMHPAVIRLAALDREEGTEYIRSLQALIQHTFNQLETAEALGIHRTTLAYRLRRLQEITGLDLSDAREMFHIAVSLKLM